MGYLLFITYSLIIFFLKFSADLFTALEEFLSVTLWLTNLDYSKQGKYLEIIHELFDIFLPYIFFVLLLKLFRLAFNKAKKRKAGVIILASFIQMFLPDPYAERTIKVVQVQKEKKMQPGQKDKAKNNVKE